MQRRMVVFRPPGTRDLIIHSCIAVDEATLSAIVGHGKPTVLIVPNSFHRSDAAVWKARFPQLVVACPAGSCDAVAKIVAVDMDAIALPQRYPHLIHAYSLPGVTARGKQPFELVFEFAVSPVPAAGRWAWYGRKHGSPAAHADLKDKPVDEHDGSGPPAAKSEGRYAFIATDLMFNVLRTGKCMPDFLYVPLCG